MNFLSKFSLAKSLFVSSLVAIAFQAPLSAESCSSSSSSSCSSSSSSSSSCSSSSSSSCSSSSSSSSCSSRRFRGYSVENLVTNAPGMAPTVDPLLINPWGLAFSEKGDLIVADNQTDRATFYTQKGAIVPRVITVIEEPTGLVRNNNERDFRFGPLGDMHSAKLLFASEAGTILAFNKNVDMNNAVPVIDRSTSGAVYKGIEVAKICPSDRHQHLYATDFHNGVVDAFDHQFKWTSSFTDPNVPAGFAPFNIKLIGQHLYVTYAKQLPPGNVDDEPGLGNGYVSVFRTDGQVVKTLISQGVLNSPWGIALAPENFGKFSHALLIGNFGDGLIHAYNIKNGKFLGTLEDCQHSPIVLPGLWALEFAPERCRESSSKRRHCPELFFTAGGADEDTGLVGVIRASKCR